MHDQRLLTNALLAGRKEINRRSNFWSKNDGRMSPTIDDSYYDEGMTWTCCGAEGRSDGCERGEHWPEEIDSNSSKRLRR